jgi:ribosomal protein S18 acetylase RimI-like enzyme
MDANPSLSPILHDELPSVVELVNEYYSGTYEYVPDTVESLMRLVDMVGAIVLAARGSEGLAGFIACIPGVRGHDINILATRPLSNHQVADLLVLSVESRVGTGTIYTWVDCESPELPRWESRGYSQRLCWYQMISPLEKIQPIPPLFHDAILRELHGDEEADLVKMVNKSFGRERLQEGCIRRWKEQYGCFDEQWIHVAEVGGQIVSVMVSAPDKQYDEHYGRRRGYLGPAATLPEFRSRGLATALVVRAMNFLLGMGMDSVSLYTAENNTPSVALLKKHGFAACHRWAEMAKSINGGSLEGDTTSFARMPSVG